MQGAPKTPYSSLASAVVAISTDTILLTPLGTTKDELTVEAIRLSIAWNEVVADNWLSVLAIVRAIFTPLI